MELFERKLNALELQKANINKQFENKTNSNMNLAKANKNDEFYTRIEDIEKEMKFYRKYFKNKIIFLNCDDPEWSNFYKYFYDQFKFLELKKIIATHYSNNENIETYKIEVTIIENKLKEKKFKLKGDNNYSAGDFRSEECVSLLKESDIVITNPPFSLFREYVSVLIKHKKKFIIMGDSKSVTYKEIFPLIKNHKIWFGQSGLGHTYYEPKVPGTINFNDPKTYNVKKLGFTGWFTNVGKPIDRKHFPLWEKYHGNESKYLKCENYDALFISQSRDMPYDYDGIMAVPPTFMEKLNTNQFEIIGECGTSNETFENYNNGRKFQKLVKGVPTGGASSNKNPIIESTKENANMYCPIENKYYKRTYSRILIKNKKVGVEG